MAEHAKPSEGVTFRTSDLTNTPLKIATWAPCRARRLHICCKGCHFAHATERPRAERSKMRQGPPPGPQPPDHPFRSRGIAKARPGGRGLRTVYGPAPSPSVSLRLCRTSISTHLLSHAGPGGRRTSPACGSCRRPLKSCDNKGIEKRMERKKISRGENQS